MLGIFDFINAYPKAKILPNKIKLFELFCTVTENINCKLFLKLIMLSIKILH